MFEEFKTVLESKYPSCSFIEGEPKSQDRNGTSYLTIAIGGIKHEGAPYNLYSTLQPTDEFLWDSWWDSFDKYAKGCKEIHIRRIPTVVVETRKVINEFDYKLPTIVEETRTQISGRFTFYK